MRRSTALALTSRLTLIVLVCVSFAHTALAETFESSTRQTTLLELFTSEGCSSCPPADAWLADFKNSDQLWDRIVPVAFHVTYWDQYGWIDPYGKAAYTQRQSDYVANWHKTSPYTPNFVRNGDNWQLWFRHPRPSPIEPESVEAQAGPLTVDRNATNIDVIFRPANTPASAPVAHVAILAFGLSSQIKAGENQGRQLNHDFVVIGHRQVTLKANGETFQASLTSPETTDVDADRYALAAWVADPGDMHTLQATGGWLDHGLTR